MISFLAGCLELCRKHKVLTMFRQSCLCLQHVVFDSPDVMFVSVSGAADGQICRKRLGQFRVI